MDLYEQGSVFPWLNDELHEGVDATRKVWEPIIATKPTNETARTSWNHSSHRPASRRPSR